MKPWKRIEPTKVAKVDRRVVVVKSFILPSGKSTRFASYGAENVRHAGVVALTPDNQVIVAEQFRTGPEKVMLEVPGGTVEAQETPRQAVLRELQEETCYKPGKIESLGHAYKDAYMNAEWHYFFATDCILVPGKQKLDYGELINVKLISIDEFIKNAHSARMTDVEAVFLAYEKLMKVKEGTA